MRHRDALQRVRKLLRRPSDDPAAPDSLSGPTLIEQEPDLAKEASRYNLAASGWAAGGQSTE